MPLKYHIIAIAASASVALAQPQAPVVWGEARCLGIGNYINYPRPVILWGDTLIFARRLVDDDSAYFRPAVSYSHDNGLTFSPWYVLDSNLSTQPFLALFGSSDLAFALVEGRTELSLDAGATWTVSRARPANWFTRWGTHAGLQVLVVDRWYSALRLVISTDAGENWGVPIPLDSSQDVYFLDVAVTQTRILLMADVDNFGSLGISVGDRMGHNFSPYSPIGPTPTGFTVGWFILGDSTSEIAVVLPTISTFGYVGDLYAYRTTDGGESWEDGRLLTEGHQLHWLLCHPQLFYRDKLWGIVWEDYWNADSTEWNVYWRFSANHGKNWYPAQRLGFDEPGLEFSSGQFVRNEVRVYWGTNSDFATITGVLTPDTLAPIVEAQEVPPDTVLVDAGLVFLATISDNDTLSREELIIREGDSTIDIPMEWTGTDYMANWTVPHEGRFFYRIEGEDFWENVGSYPDSGWAMLVTPGWSDAADDFIPHPSSFTLSIYPNPFNTTATLTFTIPAAVQEINLEIHNLLGQSVMSRKLSVSPGTFTYRFDGSDLSTGLYFLSAHAGSTHLTQKILLLR